MLRVRVVSPARLTGHLVEWLTAAPGVQNLVVLREAVRRPQGDAVHFDLSARTILGLVVTIALIGAVIGVLLFALTKVHV